MEYMTESNNPIKEGEFYCCSKPGCKIGNFKPIEADNVVFYMDMGGGITFCKDCYADFKSERGDTNLDERTFLGPGDLRYIEPKQKPEIVKSAQDKPEEKTIHDVLREKEEIVDAERAALRAKRDYEEYRDYMRDYMKEYNAEPDKIAKHKTRYQNLKLEHENSEVIDKTTPICPRCGNEKCGKAGFLVNAYGKYQRRKCMKCGFLYSDNWRD